MVIKNIFFRDEKVLASNGKNIMLKKIILILFFLICNIHAIRISDAYFIELALISSQTKDYSHLALRASQANDCSHIEKINHKEKISELIRNDTITVDDIEIFQKRWGYLSNSFLHQAVQFGNIDCVLLLLTLGADIHSLYRCAGTKNILESALYISDISIRSAMIKILLAWTRNHCDRIDRFSCEEINKLLQYAYVKYDFEIESLMLDYLRYLAHVQNRKNKRKRK